MLGAITPFGGVGVHRGVAAAGVETGKDANECHMTQFNLAAAARQEMIEHGFQPDFPAEAQQQLAGIHAAARAAACAI
jgi:hypothetical protein